MGSCLSSESSSPVSGSPLSSAPGVRKRRNFKRSGSRSSSLDYTKDDPLHRIPGRLFLNGSSEVASLFTQQGKKGTNQDAMIVWENFCSRNDTVFCGVFDGHGPYGHMVAKRVRDSLPAKLSSLLKAHKNKENNLAEVNLNAATGISCLSIERSRVCCELPEASKQKETFEMLMKHSFIEAFQSMDKELSMFTTIDCICSGSTAVTLLKQGEYLVMGNVGDSRAILGTRDKDDSLSAVQLTVDLKPNLPGEVERIRKCKGRVFALDDEPEVVRVWLPNDDSPGLAMARAFGDFCLKEFGVIAVPDISFWRLTEKDEFVVLATDGIWDVLSNKEAVDIVASAPARSSAARTLVRSAVRAWKYQYPTSKIDDCAAVCLFFDTNNASAASTTADEVNEHGKVNNCVPTDIDTEKDLSALEGVSRVDTLLNLPRFVPEKGEKWIPGEPKKQR